jgi:hypothetical protein
MLRIGELKPVYMTEWRQEVRCQQLSLNELLPFLMEVVMQGGIYFIRDFPRHPFRELLKQLQGYELWASTSRDHYKTPVVEAFVINQYPLAP